MSLFDTGIRPAVDKWLLDKAAEKRDYGDYWSASSAGYCMRKVIFERLGVPPVAEDARKQRVFSSGDLFHQWMQGITKEAGLSIAQELELQDEELMIRGHIDDLVLIDLGGLPLLVPPTKATAPKFSINSGLKPEVLTHPNIPKPLHEVNPRNIMGKEKWDEVRQEVYKASDYHCVACGVPKEKAKKHQWLEAHEYYDIDYENGKVKIKELVALCHYCHNFIHSGRLQMIMGKDKSEEEVVEILEHGFKILAENKLKAFYGTLAVADNVGADTYGVEAYEPNSGNVAWEDWRLVWEGKEYPPKFKTYEDWSKNYGR